MNPAGQVFVAEDGTGRNRAYGGYGSFQRRRRMKHRVSKVLPKVREKGVQNNHLVAVFLIHRKFLSIELLLQVIEMMEEAHFKVSGVSLEDRKYEG